MHIGYVTGFLALYTLVNIVLGVLQLGYASTLIGYVSFISLLVVRGCWGRETKIGKSTSILIVLFVSVFLGTLIVQIFNGKSDSHGRMLRSPRLIDYIGKYYYETPDVSRKLEISHCPGSSKESINCFKEANKDCDVYLRGATKHKEYSDCVADVLKRREDCSVKYKNEYERKTACMQEAYYKNHSALFLLLRHYGDYGRGKLVYTLIIAPNVPVIALQSIGMCPS